MNGISGISSSLLLGVNAMNVHSIGMQVTAHNIANVNTAEFNPQRELYATGPNGQGVELDAVTRQFKPYDLASRNAANADGFPAGTPPEFINPSGTELAREIPHMITTQRAFEANAATVRASDEMLGTLLSIKA